MSDYNVIIKNVDFAMDMLESYVAEVKDIRAHVRFDMLSLFYSLEQKIDECNRCIEREKENISLLDNEESNMDRLNFLNDRSNQLERIRCNCVEYGQDLLDEIKQLIMCAELLSTEGLQEMGRYISKLNLITGTNSYQDKLSYSVEDVTFVCVIDSSQYPQTSEHIKMAQKMGFPTVLTIDRDNAYYRRRASLENVKTSQYYDRDEYPCAVFAEGGHGADVVYVEGRDNRGAGAYMRWQLQKMPNGARVRIRVV